MNLQVLFATLYLAIIWVSTMFDDGHMSIRSFLIGLFLTPIEWWLLAWAFKTTGLF